MNVSNPRQKPGSEGLPMGNQGITRLDMKASERNNEDSLRTGGMTMPKEQARGDGK